jgi:hypothetical protein
MRKSITLIGLLQVVEGYRYFEFESEHSFVLSDNRELCFPVKRQPSVLQMEVHISISKICHARIFLIKSMGYTSVNICIF